MMRSALIRLLLISTLTVWAAFGQPAQNSDFSFLAGPVTGRARVSAGSILSVNTSGAVSIQFNFAHTIHSYSFADLWLEVPTAIALAGDANVNNGVSTVSHDTSFVAPGLRLHVPVGSRVSFYGAIGGGYGSFGRNEVSVGSGVSVVESRRTYHGVFDFGGGVDFRLTRLLSLRGEFRDYVTGQQLGGVNGRNHPTFGFGLAFHF